MLYDMGDNKFCLGSVEAPYVELISSDVMGEILMSGVAESLRLAPIAPIYPTVVPTPSRTIPVLATWVDTGLRMTSAIKAETVVSPLVQPP